MDIHVHIHDHGAECRERTAKALERIAAALEAGGDVSAATAQLKESNDKLSAAVAANTPAA